MSISTIEIGVSPPANYPACPADGHVPESSVWVNRTLALPYISAETLLKLLVSVVSIDHYRGYQLVAETSPTLFAQSRTLGLRLGPSLYVRDYKVEFTPASVSGAHVLWEHLCTAAKDTRVFLYDLADPPTRWEPFVSYTCINAVWEVGRDNIKTGVWHRQLYPAGGGQIKL